MRVFGDFFGVNLKLYLGLAFILEVELLETVRRCKTFEMNSDSNFKKCLFY